LLEMGSTYIWKIHSQNIGAPLHRHYLNHVSSTCLIMPIILHQPHIYKIAERHIHNSTFKVTALSIPGKTKKLTQQEWVQS
jgi:hypothetical protein